MLAEREPALVRSSSASQSQLLEVRRRAGRRGLVARGLRAAAHARARAPLDVLGAAAGVPCSSARRPREELFEPLDVELARLEVNAVAGADRLDAVAPSARRSPCTYTWSEPSPSSAALLAPEGVDEPVARHDTAAFERGARRAARAASARRARQGPSAETRLDRPEQPELRRRRPRRNPPKRRQADLKRPRAIVFATGRRRPESERSRMIHAGDSIENPVTGERLVFRQTSRETGGEAVVIETYVQPNGFVAAAHVHPDQEERFEVLRGSVGFKVGREKLVAGPGHAHHRPGRDAAPVLERRRGCRALRLRDPPGAAVRVADRDDVRARGRRQDEPQGNAEPAAARGDRECPLRHRAPAVPAGDPAADRARARRTARPCASATGPSTSRRLPERARSRHEAAASRLHRGR